MTLKRLFKKKIRKQEMQEIPEQEVAYSLEYLMQFANKDSSAVVPLDSDGSQFGRIETWHDISGKKWRMQIQLEPTKWWFLTVFFHETGAFDMFSLDFEAADDSHYEFQDEQKVRRAIYEPGDEKLYLHEVFIRFIRGNGGDQTGGFALLKHIPITKSFHF